LADTEAGECEAEGTGNGCTLREAVEEANAENDSDLITFKSGLTGEIELTQDQIRIDYGVKIDGPGKNVISVSGDPDDDGTGDSRIFRVDDQATISGLTLTDADAGEGERGGAVYATPGSSLLITNSVVSDSTAVRGGAIAAGLPGDDNFKYEANQASVTITNSELRDNVAGDEGGGALSVSGALTVARSEIANNRSGSTGGAIDLPFGRADLDVIDSVISGNRAAGDGGGIAIESVGVGKYDQTSAATILRSTISGNTAGEDGGGLFVAGLPGGDSLTLSDSTVSDNKATATGGGISLANETPADGPFSVSNSTVSRNNADTGGGISFGGNSTNAVNSSDTISVDNATIAANTANRGGGLSLNTYDGTSATIPLRSTIVADNTVAGQPQDLDRADGSEGGGFDLAFSLIEQKGDAPLFSSDTPANVIGEDPKLGALADNGGPTATHLPDGASPAVDRGEAPERLAADQRGEERTIDRSPANPAGGDNTDIGSVELPAEPPAPAATQQQAATPPPPPPPPPNEIARRFPPRGLTQSLSPKSDLKAPYRFTVSGRVIPPTFLSAQQACGSIGFVSVQFKRRTQTISTRRSLVRPDCSYRSTVSFASRKRFGRSRVLRVQVRFLGNQVLEPFKNKVLTARVRREPSR
ncbi:MAG: Ornithine carbamoyltransferase, partial [uncultured Solirubrobacteraceae bacterium]